MRKFSIYEGISISESISSRNRTRQNRLSPPYSCLPSISHHINPERHEGTNKTAFGAFLIISISSSQAHKCSLK